MSMSPHNPPEPSAAAPLRDAADPGTSQELLDAIQSLGDRRILLIVDRGLVQFAKFVAAQIVIFGVIGLFLFGADVKDALQEVRETRDAVRASQQDLRQTEIELTDAKEGLREQQEVVASQLAQSVSAVDELHERVDQLQKEANRHLVQIRGLHTEAETIVVGIRQLTIQEQETFSRASQSELKALIRTETLPPTSTDTERKLAESLNLWANGATLRIRFLDGTKEEQEEVKRIASEWTEHANIAFEFIESGSSHVRITLHPKDWPTAWPAWAYQGAASLAVDQGEPTVGLDVANELSNRGFQFSDARARKGYVLREFGFVLGLIDEMRNPNVPWTREEARKAVPLTHVDDHLVERYLPYEEAELPEYRDFDPKSVMLGFVPRALTNGEEMGGRNYELSDGDKDMIKRLYPRLGAGSR